MAKHAQNIGYRDEIYPAGIPAGYPGYTYEEALRRKLQQEEDMASSSNTVETIVEILPVPDRENQFYVWNRSSYRRGF